MITTRRAALLGAVALAACAPRGDIARDIAAIESLLRSTFDRPDAPLQADPIVVDGDYAIADWTQRDMGGRALLQRRDNAWAITLCAGDLLRTAEGLQSVGVERAASARLANKLRGAERGAAPERLEAMSRFAEVMRMGT